MQGGTRRPLFVEQFAVQVLVRTGTDRRVDAWNKCE